MFRFRKRHRSTRADLIEHKHQLEGQINALAAELRRQRRRGQATADLETRLNGLQNQHFQTRLMIDRTDPEA